MNNQVKKYSTLKSTVCGAAMMLSLNACLPSDNAATDFATEAEFTKAQSEYYANAIAQYAVKSSHAMTSLEAWANQTLPEGALDLTSVNFSTLDMGEAEIFISSAYCKTSATDAVHLTWFDSEDATGDFSIKGLGAGDSGYLMSALSDTVNFDSLGTYGSNEVQMSNGTTTTAILSSCGTLNIPNGAPVIVTALTLPTPGSAASAMTRFEYRTVSCAAGEEGSVQQQVRVEYQADGGVVVGGAPYENLGAIPDAAWQNVTNGCRAVAETASYSVASGFSSSAVDFAAMAPGAGGTDSIVDVLATTMTNMECRTLVDEIQAGTSTATQSDLYDTCGTTVEVAALQSIEATSVTLVEEEIVTKPCSDFLVGAECFTDSVNGDVGEACADAWAGDAVLKREVWEYVISTSGGSGPGCGDCQTVETRTEWTGLSLECTRYAQLTIECETRLPQYSDSTVYTDVDTKGFIYDRSNNVSGWADAALLTPNAPDNPTWTGFDWGCSWQKDVDFACADFTATATLTSVRGGAANRLIDVKNLAGTNIDVGDWTVTQTAQCSDEETWDCSAVAGSTLVRGGIAGRLVEILDPEGTLNDSGFNTTQTAQCRREREFTCPAGTLVQTGLQERIWEVLDAAGTIDDSDDWTTTRNSQCTDERETFGCEQRVEERTYTGTAPYEGSWSGWTTVSLINNCGSAGSGGSGGGSDICLMAGARVAMADGTTKDIANLEVGDVTISGRVMQTFARHYDESKHTTFAGHLKMGEGLFNVDGIVGTGRHAFLGKDGWVELSEAKEAQIERHDVAMLYNAVMENNIIPVVGDSGEIHYYADEMNNIDGVSERAMMRILAGEKLAA